MPVGWGLMDQQAVGSMRYRSSHLQPAGTVIALTCKMHLIEMGSCTWIQQQTYTHSHYPKLGSCSLPVEEYMLGEVLCKAQR